MGGITVIEIPGKLLTSFVPYDKDDIAYEFVKANIMELTEKLCMLVGEPYADIIDTVISDKFTPQHAILLSAILRHMDCCDQGPIDLVFAEHT